MALQARTVETMLHDAVRAELDRIMDEEIAAANERIKKRVKERVVEIGATIFNRFDVEYGRNMVTIRVSLTDQNNGNSAAL